jgi:hypothetical protein
MFIRIFVQKGDIIMIEGNVPSGAATAAPMLVARTVPATPYKSVLTPCYPGIHSHQAVARS